MQIFHQYKLFTLAACFMAALLPVVCQGQEPIRLEEERGYGLSAYAATLVDVEKSMNIEEVTAPSQVFELQQLGRISLGFNPSAHWVKFSAVNLTPSERWIFRLENNFLDSVSLYLPTKQGWQELNMGDENLDSLSSIRHQSVFTTIDLPLRDTTTFYLRVVSETMLSFEMRLEPVEIFYSNARKLDLFYAFCAGFLVLAIISNLFLFITLRDWAFLIYVGYMLAIVWNISVFSGFFQEWFLPKWGHLPNELFLVQIWLISALSLLFAKYFLRVSLYAPGLIKAVNLFLLFHLLYLPILFLWSYGGNLNFLQTLVTVTILACLGLGIYVFKQGQKAAAYYIIGYICYFTGVFFVQLDFFGFTGSNFISIHGFELGILGEIVFLSLALAIRNREEKNESQRARQEAQAKLLAMQENISRELEDKVRSRTQALQEKNEEVSAQNEELQQQQEEMQFQEAELVRQKNKIEEQNRALSRNNETLELKVVKRTKMLQEANRVLAGQVKQLEQFAFIVAHNLRGPLARLLGLANLFNDYEISKEDQHAVMQQVKESALRLDTVVADLNKILYVRQGVNEAFEEVAIADIYEKVRAVLSDTIAELGGQLSYEAENDYKISTIPAYLESIFQNLIANALRFTKAGCPPEVAIKVVKQRGQLLISFTDNGTGIDLGQHGGRLFGIYQRFHGVQSGRGIGLYLVRTQVIALDGTIEVNSRVGEGTVFTLKLPLKKDSAK